MGRPQPPLREPFEEALERANRENRWLLVTATAAWSKTSRGMEQFTWRHPALLAWVDARAHAIAVDLDADEDLARTLRIQAIPTVIAFRDRAEKDRVTIAKAADLLEWLEHLAQGMTAADCARARPPEPPERDVRARDARAGALFSAGRDQEALDELIWLWHNMAVIEPGMRGVRVSSLANMIGELARRFPLARARFGEIRDEAGNATPTDQAARREARHDWLVLNHALGDFDKTLEWFDSVKRDPGSAELVSSEGYWLVRVLKLKERWADIGLVFQDPIEWVHHEYESARITTELVHPGQPRNAHRLVDQDSLRFRNDVAVLYRGLVAAGRDAEAAQVAREALRFDDEAAMMAALDQAGARARTPG